MKLGICFFLSLASTLFSQQFINLTVEDGLSSNHVYCVYQDQLGFMWFGTNRGLDRYDGVSIRTFKHDPADSNSLSSSDIKRIYQDENGIMWIATSNGLNRFDPKTEQFTRYFFEDKESNVWIIRILAEGDSILWLGTMNGLVRFNKNSGEYKKYFWHDQQGESTTVRNLFWAIAQLGNGCLVLGTGGNDFVKFDPVSQQFSELHDFLSGQNWGSGFCAFRDSEGLVWLGMARTGVFCFDEKTDTLHKYISTDDNKYVNYPCTNAIAEDQDGDIWFGTLGGGLSRYNKKTKTFRYYTAHVGVSGSLGTNMICDLFVDKQGNIWSGSYDGGVNMLPRWSKNIRLMRQQQDEEKSIGSGAVDDLCEDIDGNIWVVSSGGGVAKIAPDFSTVTHMRSSGQAPFQYNWLQAVECDHAGNLWFCGGYCCKLDWRTKKVEWLTGPNISEPGRIWPRSAMMCMSEDSLGNMWFGSTYKGMLRYDKNHRVTAFQHHPDAPSSLSGAAVFSLICDRQGNMWAGTGAGLSCLPPAAESFINYKLCPANSDSAVDRYGVFAIFEDSRGLLWMGCEYGFFLFDRDNNCFMDKTANLGIEPQEIRAILEDKNRDLWVRSGTHLFRYDVETGESKKFSPDDGFVGINTSLWRCRDFVAASTGHIYYGGTRIVGRFHPDSLFMNPNPPPVVLTDLEVNYETVHPGASSLLNNALTFADNLVLAADQNAFTLKFAALDYTVPQRNQYAYKLDGLHETWIQAGNQHQATFTNLSPGTYTFRVKASNNDGVWNDNGASLRIRILPPWWQTTWAYLLWLAVFLGAVYAAYRVQLNRARLKQQFVLKNEQAEKLQEIDRLKSRFFANISHELRTPLTLIVGPLEKLSKQKMSDVIQTQVEIMQRNGRRLLQLIDQLLDFSKIEAGSMHLQAAEMDVIAFIKRIVASFMSAAERKNISLDFKADERVLLCYLDADKMEKVMSNLLSNAFKFTPHNGRICVHVKRDHAEGQETVKITVSDTGVGIPPGQLAHIFDRFYQVDGSRTRKTEGAGIGLALTKELIDLHHGAIQVESTVDQGSEFVVHLPLGRAHLREEEIVQGTIEESIFEPRQIEGADDPVQESTSGGGKPLVLVVEDNRDVRFYIHDLLSDRYAIREARDGYEGLQMAFKKSPDLIISDVMMPEMDGYELCEKLKTDERTSHIPVILLTARAAEADKLSGLEMGADDYIVKPFSAPELRARVRNLIEQRKKLRAIFSHKIDVDPTEITVTSMDRQFLKRAVDIVEEHMTDSSFSIEMFARLVGLSRMQLHRKIKALTDLTASQFVLVMRLKRAAHLLREHAGSVTEIAYEVGFQNPAYFSTCFRRQFGVKPSEFISS